MILANRLKKKLEFGSVPGVRLRTITGHHKATAPAANNDAAVRPIHVCIYVAQDE